MKEKEKYIERDNEEQRYLLRNLFFNLFWGLEIKILESMDLTYIIFNSDGVLDMC